MMEEEKILYLVYLNISSHANINLGIFAELENKGSGRFLVKRVISGRCLKPGMIINIEDHSKTRFRSWDLIKDYKEGVEIWNRKLRNAEDLLTSLYENKKKKLTKRLLKDE